MHRCTTAPGMGFAQGAGRLLASQLGAAIGAAACTLLLSAIRGSLRLLPLSTLLLRKPDMKRGRIIRLLSLSALALCAALGGCASTGTMAGGHQPASFKPPSSMSGRFCTYPTSFMNPSQSNIVCF